MSIFVFFLISFCLPVCLWLSLAHINTTSLILVFSIMPILLWENCFSHFSYFSICCLTATLRKRPRLFFFYSLFIVKKINLEFSVFFYSQPYERLILKLSFATSGSKVEKSNNREQTVKNMINFSKIRRKKTVMISGLKLNQFLVNINRNERCLHKL